MGKININFIDFEKNRKNNVKAILLDMGKSIIEKIKNYFIQFCLSPLFLIILGLKIISSFLFASNYLTHLFARFVNYYVISGFQNPYQYFYQLNELTVFPYPKIMLWIMAFPRWLFNYFLSVDYNFVSNFHIFIYRLPILAADIVIFLILTRWLKGKENKVFKYYWCSPILFYISYIHGQLDVLPIMFLFVFLYFLFKERFYWAFIFLGLAIATKTSVILALPFAVIYLILKKVDLVKILLLAILPLGLFIVINADYLFNPGFFEMVLRNKEQAKIFDFNYKLSGDFVIYFIPLAYLILLIKGLTYKTFNRDIFLMFLGFSFGILTLFIPPMQGWYFWVVPFLIYFYIKQDNAPKFTFIVLNIFYFLYFLTIKNSDFFEVFQLVFKNIAAAPNPYHYLAAKGFNSDLSANIAFTLLQTALLLNILWIYRKGIENNIQYKIKYQPYLIGLAGDSGSGKTTIANLFKDIFGEKNTAILTGDDMHKWERGHKMWNNVTHLNPAANRLHAELKNALYLKEGNAIQRCHYDHKNGKFTLPEKFESKKVILFEGLHSLFLNKMRTIFDLKIFINPEEQLRLHWKILRDVKERGYNKEKIFEQIKKREEDSQKYIQTQEQYADLSISLKNREKIKNIGDESEQLDIYLAFKCVNDINFEPLLDYLSIGGGLTVNHLFYDNHQLIEMSGRINEGRISEIAEDLIGELEEILVEAPRWQVDYNGLIQIFVCYYIFEKMKLDRHYG